MKRREFITAAGVGSAATAAGVTGTVGTAAAQEEGPQEVPVWPEFVTEANNYESTEDLRGQGEATVQVGAGDGFAFAPPAIWIDPGTTVIWEWTGEGGGHNVSNTGDLGFESDISSEAGFTFEYTFEEGGIFEYECVPHTSQGMHGGVAVGDEISTMEAPTESSGGGGAESTGVLLPGAAKSAGVALTVALGSTLGLAYVFMKYGGDYEGGKVE
ncbi:MAG: halocyanin domain-containing protein [Halalkalicoccus sp.]|nr:halocyanin domain-containing protein [Halalkalicoccus sp.]